MSGHGAPDIKVEGAERLKVVVIASRWQSEYRLFTGLVFAHQQGTSIGRCVEDLELMAQCCTQDEVTNRVIFIPLHPCSILA